MTNTSEQIAQAREIAASVWIGDQWADVRASILTGNCEVHSDTFRLALSQSVRAVLAAVAIVMDAARADALEEAAKVCEFLAKTLYDDAASINTALECRAAIRDLAQAHRELKP